MAEGNIVQPGDKDPSVVSPDDLNNDSSTEKQAPVFNYGGAIRVPSSKEALLQTSVDVRAPSGRNYKLILPEQFKGESDEDFQKRTRQAEVLASSFEIGQEVVESYMERYPTLNPDEALIEAYKELDAQLQGAEGFKESLSHLPRNDRNKPIFDRATLDIMKYRAQMDALKKYFSYVRNRVEFQEENGSSGMAINLDARGNVLPPVKPTTGRIT